MNRLILLGNGFDLAHGLKTDYNSFIIWYLTEAISRVVNGKEHDDDLLSVYNSYSFTLPFANIKSPQDYVNLLYKQGFLKATEDKLQIPGWGNQKFPNPFIIKVKSNLMRTLLNDCSMDNWVDIENQFYNHLKRILNGQADKQVLLNDLNKSLKCIINELEKYLLTIDTIKSIYDYQSILTSQILLKDNPHINLSKNQPPKQSLILNFNYTSTIENYIDKNYIEYPLHIPVNYIHGRLNSTNNPLIFGFGDELDSDYSKMELEKTKGFFEYIKSFWYFRTTNYHDLIRFIDNDDFQIYILGHSCGLSDRTMLNMIFEHKNCKSIKIYYYDNGVTNNYTELTQEISRHFKNKSIMRDKIVSLTNSEPMPQLK